MSRNATKNVTKCNDIKCKNAIAKISQNYVCNENITKCYEKSYEMLRKMSRNVTF